METPPAQTAVPWRDRVRALADHPAVLRILFAASFIEASVFPLPPDLVLVPLGLARPRRAFRAATVCVAGSVAGALAGYMIGAALVADAGNRLLAWAGLGPSFDRVLALYAGNAVIALLGAGFTAIPFSVFTIAAGFRHTVPLFTFIAGTVLGRGVRFYLLACALRAGGPFVQRMVNDHLAALSLALLLLAALVIAAWRIFP